MATRSTIKIEGNTFCKIYKHYDGYPEGMTEWLTEFNKDFHDNRGDDPNYKTAQLLRHSAHLPSPKIITYPDVFEETHDYDTQRYTGWGIVPFNADCGEDYEYLLKKDGTISYKGK